MLLKLAILISGRGSNMKSILNAVQKQNIPIKPAIVISNKPSAKGLKIARNLGVQTEIVESKGFQGSRWDYDQKIILVLSKYDITLIISLIVGFSFCFIGRGHNKNISLSDQIVLII